MFVRDPKRLAPYVQQLKEYFTGTRRVFDVPIDISEFGTEFQRRVLQAVQRIPYGMTISYEGVATSMPDASSYRSVEHAVALNRYYFSFQTTELFYLTTKWAPIV